MERRGRRGDLDKDAEATRAGARGSGQRSGAASGQRSGASGSGQRSGAASGRRSGAGGQNAAAPRTSTFDLKLF